MSKDEDVTETVTNAVKGEDRPMDETQPAAPAALVFLTYPVILIIVLVLLGIAFMIFR